MEKAKLSKKQRQKKVKKESSQLCSENTPLTSQETTIPCAIVEEKKDNENRVEITESSDQVIIIVDEEEKQKPVEPTVATIVSCCSKEEKTCEQVVIKEEKIEGPDCHLLSGGIPQVGCSNVDEVCEFIRSVCVSGNSSSTPASVMPSTGGFKSKKRSLDEPITDFSSERDLKTIDYVFLFSRKAGNPLVVLKILKYIYSITSIRPFLYQLKEFLELLVTEGTSFHSRKGIQSNRNVLFLLSELSNIGGLSQQKSLDLLERSNLWEAYIVYNRYGDKRSGLSRQVKRRILEFVDAGTVEAKGIDDDTCSETTEEDNYDEDDIDDDTEDDDEYYESGGDSNHKTSGQRTCFPIDSNCFLTDATIVDGHRKPMSNSWYEQSEYYNKNPTAFSQELQYASQMMNPRNNSTKRLGGAGGPNYKRGDNYHGNNNYQKPRYGYNKKKFDREPREQYCYIIPNVRTNLTKTRGTIDLCDINMED